MNSNSRIDKAILILLSVILVGIVGLYLIANRMVMDRREIESTKQDIRTEYLRRERFDQLFNTFQEINKKQILGELEKIIPAGEDFLPVIEELEQIGKTSGNSIIMRLGDLRLTSAGFEIDTKKVRNQTVTGASKPAGANYDFIEIEATIRGDYADLEQFIHVFKQSKYYMNITSMSISRARNSDNTVVLDTFMTIQVFVQKVVFSN